MVVEIDSTAPANQSGEIWINDLRLSGINKNTGTSMRTEFQADFADFFNIGGNITVTDGNFISLTQVDGGQKKTPANSKTSIDFNSTAGLFANKFLPDKWGVGLPLTLQYQGSILRPFTKPTSDELLIDHDIKDFLDDLLNDELSSRDLEDDQMAGKSRFYQTRTFKESFTASYSKEKRSKNFAVQSLFERPTFQYIYSKSKSSSPIQDDTTKSYKSKLAYDLSPYKPLSFEPLKFTKK